MASLTPGTILQGRYRIVADHETGGSAMVYTAERVGLDEGVKLAVKEVDPSIIEFNEFENEARLLYSLNHPNIPKVYDFFVDDGKYYLVMEFIEGTSLETLVIERGQGINPRDALRYGLQICDVFSYLHGLERKVIHRDLKPGNLMLTRTGAIKLIDFGIARTYKPDQKSDTLYAYSAYTASPEQKANLATDERSDIYSFGATLYCLVMGEAPPQSITESDDGRDPVLRLLERRASGLAKVVWKCMRYEPVDRYQSFDAVRDELSELLDGTTRRNRVRRWSRVAGLVITAGLIIGGVYWFRRPALPPSPTPVVELGTVTGTSEVVAGRPFTLELDGVSVADSQILWVVRNAINAAAPVINGSGTAASFTLNYPGIYEAVPVDLGATKQLAEPFRISVVPTLSGPSEVLIGTTSSVVLVSPTDSTAVRFRWQVTDPAGKTSEQTTGSHQFTLAPDKVGSYSVKVVVTLKRGEATADVASAPVTFRAVDSIVPVMPKVVNDNGSFTALNNNGFPDGWTADGDGAVNYDSSTGYGRKGCLLFAPGGRVSGVVAKAFTLEPNGQYRLTVWIRSGAANGTLTIRIRYRSAQNETFTASDYVRSVTFSGGSQMWKQTMLTFTAPDTKTNAEIHLDFAGNGQIWLDDLYVERP